MRVRYRNEEIEIPDSRVFETPAPVTYTTGNFALSIIFAIKPSVAPGAKIMLGFSRSLLNVEFLFISPTDLQIPTMIL